MCPQGLRRWARLCRAAFAALLRRVFLFPMHCTVIIPAAGIGSRFGSEIPKQYTHVAGQPVLAATIERFLESGLVSRLIVATSAEDEWWAELFESRRWEGVERVQGGATRQESVLSALRVAGDDGLVAVHDAVRPYFRLETFRRLLEAAEKHGAALPALPLRETVHRVIDGEVKGSPDRSELWAAQTPQCFRLELLQEVMERAWHEGLIGTDEASLVARYDHPVKVIEGDVGNIKITTPDDVVLIEELLKGRTE